MQRYALGDICEIVSGSTPKTNIEEYWNGDIKWITPAELDEESYIINDTARKITKVAVEKTGISSFPKGTVLLSSRAPIGKVAIAGCEMYCNQGFKNLICKEKVYNRYLYWFLKRNTKYLNSLGRGATFKEISKQIVSEIEINLPEMEHQKIIVEILEKLMKIIRLRKLEIKKLEKLKNARFVELFGHPLNNTKGWIEQRLGECCVINPKKNTDNRLKEDLVVSFIPMASVSENGEILELEDKFYRDVKNGFTYFCDRDVLFAKITPCMENGKGAVAVGLKNGIGFGSTEFHVLRPIIDKSNSYWLYSLTSFGIFRKKAEENMTGSAGQKRVPASFLENIQVSVPPINIQNEFEKFVLQIDKSKVEVQRALDEAQLLFDSLMQKYFG